MTQLKEIKILRLTTGEDIIASCIFDDESFSVLVDNPMKIYVSRASETKQTILVLMPWLPIELIEEDTTYIKTDDVIAVMNPKPSFEEYYTNMVESFDKVDVEDEQPSFETKTIDELEDEESFLDDELSKALETLSNNRDKKTLLH